MSASSVSTVRRPLLIDALPGARVRDAIAVVSFAMAIALSAQITFPLPGTPVRFTAQTFIVLLGAAALGARRSAWGATLFLVAGQIGLPWYAHAGGYTLGYIVGFVIAATLVGALARRGWVDGYLGAAGTMALGNLIIYACALPVLMMVLSLDLSAALALGVVPFLVGDAAKILLASALLPSLQRAVDHAAPQ